MRLLSFSPSARSASSATRVALQSRSRSLSLSERTEKPPFGGLFLLRNGHRPVRNPASPVFSPAPGPIRTARNGLSAVGRCGHGRASRLPRRTLWVRFRFQSRVQGRGPLGLQYVDSGRLLRANCGHSARAWRTGKVDRGCVKTSARFHTSLFRSLLRGLRAFRVEKIAKNLALLDRLQNVAEFLHGLRH